MEHLYIPRQLTVGERTYSEEQLLRVGSVFIVLAEPGAGKTDLLGKLAALLGVTPVRASVFRSRQISQQAEALVIDAMDEVARIDLLAMDDIVVKASDATKDVVVFAGRSSEWDPARTEHVKDCFGTDPVVVKLEPFTEGEQRQLFEAKFPGEDFDAFVAEAQRFELVPLFGNPQFLQLFGEAYVESGHTFTSKKAIFSDAVRRLAHEANKQVSQTGRPPLDRIIDVAGEVFAKLLLSGASGVSATDELNAREFPYLPSLVLKDPQDGRFLTDTRLLKPSFEPGKHEPVHRIVAEYCAARYLVGRIDDPGNRLSLPRVLAVIAPSGVVRTELRGMLGWMAALAREATQRELVDIDPYAVLANGDPSELTPPAKRQLIKRLGKLAEADPLFRRSDVWRRFNVGKFFTPDVQGAVAAILDPNSPNSSMRDLLLELLPSSQAAPQFANELRAIALNAQTDLGTRKAAYSALLDISGYDPRGDIELLMQEDSRPALELAAKAVREFGSVHVDRSTLVRLLRRLADFYPNREDGSDRDHSSRYFIKQLVRSLDLQTIAVALDALTDGLTCSCNPRFDFECRCRPGISKIVGELLDRYLSAVVGPLDPSKIWEWAKALVYRRPRSEQDSPAVKRLGEETELRRAVQRLAVAGLANTSDAEAAVSNLFQTSTHSGIHLHSGDMEALAQFAFEQGDVAIWSAVWVRHNIHNESGKVNSQRTLQRQHAREDAKFMRAWARRERAVRQLQEDRRYHLRYRRRRFERQEAEAAARDRAHLFANRSKIEGGEHWGWLKLFALNYLLEPEKLTNPDYGDTPVRALRNCIPFLSQHIPTLEALAQQRGSDIAEVLAAHCIVRFREGTPLDQLEPNILLAAATEMGSYPTFKDDGELNAIESELHRLVFAEAGSAEAFARTFIEPPLRSLEETHAHVNWLNYKPVFHAQRATLPLEWLERYPSMPNSAMRTLFAMAAKYGDRKRLIALIDRRVADPVPHSGTNSDDDKRATARHQFWILNAFFFATPGMEIAWRELIKDPRSLLAIAERVGRFGYSDDDAWPPLTAESVCRVLDAFVLAWPKVPLPNSYGSGDPDDEAAYRFLRDITWKIAADLPARKLPVLDRLVADNRFGDFREVLLTLRAETLRQIALQDFRAPSPKDVSALLDHNEVASVEDLRALIVEELQELQKWLKGVETDPVVTFYNGDRRVDENTGRNRVVDRLSGRMTALGLSVVIERHMAGGNRCDFTATAPESGQCPLLVVEVKGQWNPALYTAASAQLNDRYAIHPDAAGQGVYLVFWFGGDETIAGKVDDTITTAGELRDAILAAMSDDLKKAIDVVALDVSRPVAKPKKPKAKTPKESAKGRVPSGSAAKLK